MLIFFPLFLIILLLAWTVHQVETRAQQHVLEENLQHTIELQEKNISADIETITSDLVFLSGQSELQELLDAGGSLNEDTLSELSEEFKVFATARRWYDQVRFLDEKGMEIIRVNYNNGRPSIVPKAELQDKSNRYYFTGTMGLKKWEIFVSPLDLNIEHSKIEQPQKPMLRFAIPVFDSQRKKRGIIILNYLGKFMLERFRKLGSVLRVPSMLLNEGGYWLKGLSHEEEWGFMYPNSEHLTFGHKYKDEWKKIHLLEEGTFETPAGLFVFNTVYPLLEARESWQLLSGNVLPGDVKLNAGTYKWKIVSHVPSPLLYRYSRALARKIALTCFILAVFILIGAFRVAYAGAIRIANEKMRQELDTQILKAQKLESLNIMAGSIAHNFNNLLMVVSGGLELVLPKLENATAVKNVKLAADAADRAAELSKMMLTYVGQGLFNSTECDFGKLMKQEAVAFMARKPGYADVDINLARRLPLIKSDPAILRQIFGQITENALEALENKEGTITIRTGVLDCKEDYFQPNQFMESMCTGPYVYLEVSDSGVGMDEDTLSRIFDPFFTTKFTGRGLGLPFVLGGVRSHKGFVKVESKPNRGTTVRVLFPVLKQSIDEPKD